MAGSSFEHIDCVVIGAGVVGLAVARELSQAGREVVVLETANIIGSGTSSRNSEVIHAGIYYARDSLKAKLCVAGKKRLYEYCKSHGVAHERCGKLIVATNPEQQATLQDIAQKASNNGVDDLQLLSQHEVRAMEPEISAVAALLSPSTGIVDSHALMLSLQGEAEQAGAMLAFGSTVTGLQANNGKMQLSVDSTVDTGAAAEGIETMHLEANTVINSAGLGALGITRNCKALAATHQPRQVLAKGNYFSLACKAPVSRLIYPVPETGGLGVHITLDLAGRVRFGPDVQWIDKIDYHVDPQRAEAFYAAIRTYWPALPDNSLMPEYAGVRPKIAFGEEPSADFMISGPRDHGVPGLVNLFGIEYPGLTSSLAIAAEVHELTRVL